MAKGSQKRLEKKGVPKRVAKKIQNSRNASKPKKRKRG